MSRARDYRCLRRMQPDRMFAPTRVLRARDCSVYAYHAVAYGENQCL
jgi:hypothetical protein